MMVVVERPDQGTYQFSKLKAVITVCSFWAPHARVPTGKEKIDDTDGIIDSSYHEELVVETKRSEKSISGI